MDESEAFTLSQAVERAVFPRGFVCFLFERSDDGAVTVDTVTCHCNLDMSPDELAELLEQAAANFRAQQPARQSGPVQ